MGCNMKPPVAKTRLLPELRARVLELRRTHSTADVARQTGLSVGTVKAICSRAGTTRDNTAARAFFALPPLALTSTTAVTAPAPLPQQRNVTGDVDIDAMLWLREVIQTGDSALIDTAIEAAKRVKTPVKELERRYGDYLLRASGGNTMQAVFGSIGFGDLKELAERTLDKKARCREAVARFGSEQAVFADTAPELFCIDALAKVKREGRFGDYPLQPMCKAFEAHADKRPHTLSDCMAELAFWDALYHLRSAWPNSGDDLPQVSARRDYLHHCMGVLRCKGRDEAKAVLRYLAGPGQDALDEQALDLVLQNLIG